MPLKKAKLTPHLYTNCADLNMGIGIYCRFFSIALQEGHTFSVIENIGCLLRTRSYVIASIAKRSRILSFAPFFWIATPPDGRFAMTLFVCFSSSRVLGLFAQDQAPLPIPQCAGEQVMIPAIANRQPFFQVLDRAGKVS